MNIHFIKGFILIVFSLWLSNSYAEKSAYDISVESKSIIRTNSDDDQALLNQVVTIVSEDNKREVQAFLQQSKPQNEDIEQVRDFIFKQSGQTAVNAFNENFNQIFNNSPGSQIVTSNKLQITYLVSFSMSDVELKTVFSEALGKPYVKIMFQGLRDDKTFGHHLTKLSELLKDYHVKPVIGLDPTIFITFDVQTVPQVVAIKNGENFRAKGLISTQKIKQLIAKNQHKTTRDFGTFSQHYEIAETNLIELMKQRAEAYDWEGRQKEIKNNYWAKENRFIDLPKAEEYKKENIPSLVHVNQDIKIPGSDRYLARKGETFDLVKRAPFHKWYLIVDASDEHQLNYIDLVRDKAKNNSKELMIIFNKFSGSWKAMGKLQKRIQQPVMILPKQMKQRFKITAVPTIVRIENDTLIKEEIKLDTQGNVEI
jgi:conjugal transfer pilus assembly protein TraW